MKKIEVMVNGERLYVVPWAIQYDAKGNPYLRTDYEALAEPHGNATQTIDRLQNGSFRMYTPDPRFFNADGTPKKG